MAAATESARRGWYRGWSIVAVCILAGVAANGLPINSFSLFLKAWSATLRVPISTLQLGIASVGFGSSLLSPFAGIIIDKVPARILFGLGLVGLALFNLGIGTMSALWQYIALYAAVLAPSLLLTTSLVSNAVVCRWFVRRRGLALGVTSFGLGLGGVVIPPLAAALMDNVGWRVIWMAAALLTVAVVLPLLLLVMRDRPDEGDGTHYLTDDGAPARILPHGPGAGSTEIGWTDILTRRNFWLLVITYLPMLAAFGGIAQNLGPIVESRGFSPHIAGVFLSLLSLTQVVGTLLVGALSDRFATRGPLAALSFLVALGATLVALGHNVVLLGAGVMLAGLGNAFWPLLGGGLAREFGAGAIGRAFGLAAFFVPVVALVPFVVARVKEATGAYMLAFTGLAVLSVLVGLICAAFLQEKPLVRLSSNLPAE